MLLRGVREVRAPVIMVINVAAIMIFFIAAVRVPYIQLLAFTPNGVSGVITGVGILFDRLHCIRFRVDGSGRMPPSSINGSDWHFVLPILLVPPGGRNMPPERPSPAEELPQPK
jgi:hypothetical protein